MSKVGICFPEYDYLNMEKNQFKQYLNQFIDHGLYSFDMFTSLITNSDDKIYDILTFLNEKNIKLTFHYHTLSKIENILDEDNMMLLLNQYKDDLTKLHNKLKRVGINYDIDVVFHALDYIEEYQKYFHETNLIYVFKELLKYSKPLKINILLETISHSHPINKHIGDDIYELESIIDKINDSNFGICWDIGHTRMNSIESNDNMYLTDKIINKVKFTHIHNIYIDSNNKILMDHLPLTDLDLQEEEIDYLKSKNYDGIYSIEVSAQNLKENIEIYLNSIDLLIEKLGGK